MKQFGKWLLVGVVTIIALKYTYGLLYNVFQPFSDFLITHLSFPDWLANFLGGTFHTSVYVLAVWWFSGILGLIPRLGQFIEKYGWVVFILSWLGISATIIIALLVLAAIAICYLFSETMNEPSESNTISGGGMDTSVQNNIRRQDDRNKALDERDRIERGLQHQKRCAERGGNQAEARYYQDKINANRRNSPR